MRNDFVSSVHFWRIPSLTLAYSSGSGSRSNMPPRQGWNLQGRPGQRLPDLPQTWDEDLPRIPNRRGNRPNRGGLVSLVLLALVIAGVVGGVKLWPRVSNLLGTRTTITPFVPGATPLTTPIVNAEPPQMLSIDKLSPELASYVASQNGDLGVAVLDLGRNVEYGANQDTFYTLASSSKVNIMLAYLEMIEKQNRTLTSDEDTSLTGMIEQSDNGNGSFGSTDYQSGAQPLYAAMGYRSGQDTFYREHGLPYHGCDYGWGCAESTPAGIVQSLSLLEQGKILTDKGRAYALNLMSNTATDERFGVGDNAPPGTKAYMKNGWAPNESMGNQFDINSTGWIVTSNDVWVIAVYSQRQAAWDRGAATPPELVDHSCKLIVKALTGRS